MIYALLILVIIFLVYDTLRARHEWSEASRHRVIYQEALLQIYQDPLTDPRSIAQKAVCRVAYEDDPAQELKCFTIN
jgi:hypothetical protein